MLDKSKELVVSLDLLNEKLNFEGNVRGAEPLSIDYYPQQGDNIGYTPLELLLLSLASCFGSNMLILLKEMHKTIIGLDIIAKGIRKEEQPSGFKSISIILNLKSKNVTVNDMEKVIQLSRESFSPVWSMLKGNVDLDVKCTLVS